MWAEPAWSHPAAEDAAVRAALLAKVAGITGWALVHRCRRWRAQWDRHLRGGVTPPPSGLAAGGRADLLASQWCVASRCWHTGQGIVTPSLRNGLDGIHWRPSPHPAVGAAGCDGCQSRVSSATAFLAHSSSTNALPALAAAISAQVAALPSARGRPRLA